jgi:hypothetical protein
VLGFEDHELATGGGGAGVGAGATNTSNTTGSQNTSNSSGMGGEGGQPPVVVFGAAEEIGDAGDALTELVVDGSEIYALSPPAAALVVFMEGQPAPSTVTSALDAPRGLVLDGQNLVTSANTGTNSEVLSITKAGVATPILSVVDAGNLYLAVGAEGGVAMASIGIEVRSSQNGGDGTLIGKAFNGSNVPAVARAGNQYFWVDTVAGRLLRTAGQEVQPQHMPPGNQVDTVASMAGPVDLVIRAGDAYVVGEGGVGRVSASANNGTFAILSTVTDNPKGISADSTHVYWADGSGVRAIPIGADAGQPQALYQGSETPNDTFSDGDAVFFTTQSGKLFRVTKTLQ